MKKVLETILGIYSFILYFILSFLIHVITAYCVYDSYGAFLGIVAFFSPAVSTLIMVIIYTIFFGLFNGFNIIVFIYLLLYVPLILLTILIDKLDKKELKIETNPKKQKYILWEKRVKTPEEMTEKEYNDKWFNELVEKNKKDEEEKAKNEWQEYLEKNFKTEGTRTYSKNILIEKTNKFCTNCGKEINENWNFCNHCGHKLN